MGIPIIRYECQGLTQWGVVREGNVIAVPGSYETLAAFLQEGWGKARDIFHLHANESIPIDQIKILSPITKPTKIIGQGFNYGSHRKETGRIQRPSFNVLYLKADSSLCGPTDDIVRPKESLLLDYEIELGLVIRKQIASPVQVTEENLHEYVAGIVIANDISARDVQILQVQVFKGKSYRTFCPTGPYLYLLEPEDFPYMKNLELKLWVNEELRQNANTNELLYQPEETLTELSNIMDLSAGDLVMTGTPGGVAIRIPPDVRSQLNDHQVSDEVKRDALIQSQINIPNYLKEGDVIRSSIKSADGKIDLGMQCNRVVFSKSST